MILVTTAGKVGSETARLLRERDVPVRVLVRDPAKATARALAEAGAEIGRASRPPSGSRDSGGEGGWGAGPPAPRAGCARPGAGAGPGEGDGQGAGRGRRGDRRR